MSIANVIEYLKDQIDQTDITLRKGASVSLISEFERATNVRLPNDIKQFYQFSNGFDSAEYLFNIIPLERMIEDIEMSRAKHLYLAEYLIYSDTWELEIATDSFDNYKISNTNHDSEQVVLTNSFAEFLERYLTGGVFKPGGLYDWYNENKPKS